MQENNEMAFILVNLSDLFPVFCYSDAKIYKNRHKSTKNTIFNCKKIEKTYFSYIAKIFLYKTITLP